MSGTPGRCGGGYQVALKRNAQPPENSHPRVDHLIRLQD
jgi:hypothetical protein